MVMCRSAQLFLTVLVACVPFLPGPALHADPDPAELDRENGFRDRKFGQLLKETKGMVVKESLKHGRLVVAEDPADEMEVYGLKLSRIHYDFVDGMLWQVCLHPAGEAEVKRAPVVFQGGFREQYRDMWRGSVAMFAQKNGWQTIQVRSIPLWQEARMVASPDEPITCKPAP